MPGVPLIQPVKLWSLDAAHSRRVTWLELFFDLIFVAAVAQVGVALAADYSLHGLARFSFMFLLIWWAWLGHTMYATRFDIDDGLQRLLTLVQVFAAAAMAANAKASFDSRDSAGFGAAYAVLRVVLVVQYLRARTLPSTRKLTTAYAAGFGLAAVLWGLAAFVPAPARFWLWGLALLIDLGTPWVIARHTHRFPPDPAHLPERFGLFTIILLGESVAAVMRGMESQESWPLSAAVSAFLGMALAFGFWWWYFDRAQGAAERHIRSGRDTTRFHIWSYAHLPLYLSIAVTGVGIEHAVSLPPGAHLHGEDTWILTGAVFTVMFSLVVIGSSSGKMSGRERLVRLALAAAALPAGLAAGLVPACVLVAHFAVLCLLNSLWVGGGSGLRSMAPQ